jgi:hypothetical protein
VTSARETRYIAQSKEAGRWPSHPYMRVANGAARRNFRPFDPFKLVTLDKLPSSITSKNVEPECSLLKTRIGRIIDAALESSLQHSLIHARQTHCLRELESYSNQIIRKLACRQMIEMGFNGLFQAINALKNHRGDWKNTSVSPFQNNAKTSD